MALCVGLARVAGYCRVREYDGCATQNEIDVGLALRLSRPATPDEAFSYMLRNMTERRRLDAQTKKERDMIL